MSFCCPPNKDPCETCLSVEDFMKLSGEHIEMDSSITALWDLLAAQGDPKIDLKLADLYLKLIQQAAMNADQNSVHSSGSALQSQVIFNNNYKLIKRAFENLYELIKRLNGSLAYRLINVDVDYTLSSAELYGNPIFRIVQPVRFVIDDVATRVYEGKIIHIRNCTNQMVTIETTNGVVINPADAAHLRREGSTIGLIYVGNKQWDIYGELP